MNKLALITAALLAALVTTPAMASAVPVGTLITATASGAATGLLGLDHGFANVPGTATTALIDNDLEFLTNDNTAMVDFFADGSIQFYANTTDGRLPGNYTLSFSFAGLSDEITGFALTDLSQLLSGSIAPVVIDGHTISISFTDLVFKDAFESFTGQLSLSPAATVPEPSSLALLALSLGLMVVRQRRGQA